MVGRFNIFGPWLIDPQKDPRSTPNYLGFVLFVVLVVASARWAWKRRERAELTLFAVLSVATVLGFFSTTRIFGTFFDYVIRWMSPLVAMWIAACLWSCWLTWRAREASPSNNYSMITGVALVAALMTVVTAIGVARATSAEIPYQRDSTLTGALSAQLERSLDPTVRYQINEFDPVALGSAAFGLALELERHHLHAGVGPWGEAGVMPFRVVSDEQAEIHAVVRRHQAGDRRVLGVAGSRRAGHVRRSQPRRGEALGSTGSQLVAGVVRGRTTGSARLALQPMG